MIKEKMKTFYEDNKEILLLTGGMFVGATIMTISCVIPYEKVIRRIAQERDIMVVAAIAIAKDNDRQCVLIDGFKKELNNK